MQFPINYIVSEVSYKPVPKVQENNTNKNYEKHCLTMARFVSPGTY